MGRPKIKYKIVKKKECVECQKVDNLVDTINGEGSNVYFCKPCWALALGFEGSDFLKRKIAERITVKEKAPKPKPKGVKSEFWFNGHRLVRTKNEQKKELFQ